jgi:hypothetical protein
VRRRRGGRYDCAGRDLYQFGTGLTDAFAIIVSKTGIDLEVLAFRPTQLLDRLIFAGLYRLAPNVLNALAILKPETVLKCTSGRSRERIDYLSRLVFPLTTRHDLQHAIGQGTLQV